MIQGKHPHKDGYRANLENNFVRSPFAVALLLALVVGLLAVVAALPVYARDARSEMASGRDPKQAGECDFDDPFEPNDEPGDAKPLLPNGPLQHLNFHQDADEDWFLFQAAAGATYTITTSNLSDGADTILFLFKSPNFGEDEFIALNDDFGGTFASQIVWTAPQNGLYFFKVRDFNWQGDCFVYDLNFDAVYFHYWPFLNRHPVPTPTITPTFTPSPTPAITPTHTPTPPITPTPSLVLGTGLAFPNDVAVNPQTHHVYVASRDTDRVIAIDTTNNQVVASIPVCQKPFGIDVNSDTNKLYVACFAGGVVGVIDGDTNIMNKTISVGPSPTYVGVNESTNRVYVVTHGDGRLVEIDGASDTRTRSVGTDRGAFGLAVNEYLNRVYVTNRDVYTISTVDTNTMSTIVSQAVQPGANKPVPFGLGFNPTNGRLYVTYEKSGQLIKVAVYQANAGGLARIGTLTIPDGGGDAPGVLGVNPTTNHIFIPNSASNSVTVIDSVSNSILYNMPLGLGPFGVDVDPVTNKAYVVTKNSHQLWMILDE